MEKIRIGLDFGTTNTSVACMKYDNRFDFFHPQNFKLFKGEECIKTLITYMDSNNFWIGEEALQKATSYPKGFVSSIKRKIVSSNRFYNEKTGKMDIDIVADILYKIREELIPRLPHNTQIEGVVMGIPIGFTDLGKEVYLNALVKAGFYENYRQAYKKTIFVSEPIAAVLNYNLSLKDDKKIMVFDFGGGTLDIVIMKMKNVLRQNEIQEHEVISKYGEKNLGGNDFDFAILENIIADKYGIRPLKRDLRIASFEDIYTTEEGVSLMTEIQNVKKELSRFNIENLNVNIGNLDLNMQITRDEFEMAIQPYMNKIKMAVNTCLANTNQGIGIRPDDIDVVFLSGGSSLVPLVRKTLYEIFGNEKVKIDNNPMTCISQGLALRGHNYDGTKFSDLLEHSYGIEAQNTENNISYILSKDQKINDINSNEYFRKFKFDIEQLKDKNMFSFNVFEDNERIGVARIPLKHKDLVINSELKIYFKIEEDLGKLELNIYDTTRNRKIMIPTKSKYFYINRNEV